MFFVKFENIAVFAKRNGKLVARGSLNFDIIYLETDDMFKKLSKKYPYANSKRLDYFGEKTKTVIPGYVMNQMLLLPEVVSVLNAIERDLKLKDLLDE